jgi:hypothetical protein
MIKALYRPLAHYLIPPGIQEIVQRIIYLHGTKLTSQEKALISKNKQFHNIHQAERCFILATGPSIKEQDISFLKNEICIAVSNFFVHPEYSNIKPKYYCIAPYHLPITEDAWQIWMDEIAEHLENTKLFFSLSDLERNHRSGRFKENDVYYLSFREEWKYQLKRELDLSKSIPAPASVPITALMLAIYMGFEKIYLLGCDHDWILHVNESKHFYEEKSHALNRHGYDEWPDEDFSSHCLSYVTLWDAYKNVIRLSKNQSTKIFNATPKSLLDIFPRVSLEKITNSNKP